MRIQVLGEAAIAPQARTYAEYRVFAAVAALARPEQVRSARVVLRRVRAGEPCAAVACTVTLILDGEVLRIRGIGDHPYAAINRAVDRLKRQGRRASAASQRAAGDSLESCNAG